MANETILQAVPTSNPTTDLTDFTKGMRDLTAALRRFAERANEAESDGDGAGEHSDGCSEETRQMLEGDFFAAVRP